MDLLLIIIRYKSVSIIVFYCNIELLCISVGDGNTLLTHPPTQTLYFAPG